MTKAPRKGILSLVAMGANIPSQDCTVQQTMSRAVIAMVQKGFMIRAISRFFQTPCFPVGAGPDYVNAAVLVQSKWDAQQTLQMLHQIEAEFGRERLQRWGQRTLDLDLIGMGDAVVPDERGFREWFALDPAMQAKAAPDHLVLPHPRMQDRAFVLVPLADVMPEWKHPVLGQSVREMLGRLPASEIKSVKPI